MMIQITKIKNNPNNPRSISNDALDKLMRSISQFPEMMEKRPMVCVTDSDSKIYPLGGNMRLKAIKKLGKKEIPATWIMMADDWTEEQRRQFIIKDNASLGEWSTEELLDGWSLDELDEWGVDISDWSDDEVEEKEQNKKLSDRFIIPPFSVLDTKQGAWQDRKRYWLSLGIESELGRESTFVNFSSKKNNELRSHISEAKYSDKTKDVVDKIMGSQDGNSIFDPVLCELSYQWFNVPNGKILDPFAGGSVRGIVAAKLGFEYLGNDLREEQITANRANAKQVLTDSEIYPVWTTGDSLNIDKIAKGYEADMVFSCPPYADLEVYSDKKEDISNMNYVDFLNIYQEIIRKSCEMLKEDRFAVFVVGDVRKKVKGGYSDEYVGLIKDTIHSFVSSGLKYYNHMILCNPIGSAGLTAAKSFNGGRKIRKVHQDVLVFYKGNPRNIKLNYPELDLSYIEDQIEE